MAMRAGPGGLRAKGCFTGSERLESRIALERVGIVGSVYHPQVFEMEHGGVREGSNIGVNRIGGRGPSAHPHVVVINTKAEARGEGMGRPENPSL
jgi:hypothetical protein